MTAQKRRRAGGTFAALVLVMACGSGADLAPGNGGPADIPLCVQRALEGEWEVRQALLHGSLVGDSARLRIHDEAGDERYVPVRPSAARLQRVAGHPTVGPVRSSVS